MRPVRDARGSPAVRTRDGRRGGVRAPEGAAAAAVCTAAGRPGGLGRGDRTGSRKEAGRPVPDVRRAGRWGPCPPLVAVGCPRLPAATHCFGRSCSPTFAATRSTPSNMVTRPARSWRGFAEAVEGAVIRHRGRLIELRGDEALVVFESAREALQAAIASRRAVQASDLARGVGRWARRRRGGTRRCGYRGGALNMAARLCSLAGPGDSARHRKRHPPGAQGRGHPLPGGQGGTAEGHRPPVRVVEVVPHQRGDALSRRLRRRTHGRRWIPLAGIAAAIVQEWPCCSSSRWRRQNRLLVPAQALSCWTSRPASRLGSYPLGDRSTGVPRVLRRSHVGDELHSRCPMSRSIPQTGRVLTQFAPPSGSHDTTTYQPYAVEGTSLWTGSGHDLVRMDTDLGKEVDRFTWTGSPAAPAWLRVSPRRRLVWVGRDAGIGQIVAFDPATGKLRHRFNGVRITWTSPTPRDSSGQPTSVELSLIDPARTPSRRWRASRRPASTS